MQVPSYIEEGGGQLFHLQGWPCLAQILTLTGEIWYVQRTKSLPEVRKHSFS